MNEMMCENGNDFPKKYEMKRQKFDNFFLGKSVLSGLQHFLGDFIFLSGNGNIWKRGRKNKTKRNAYN